LLRNQTFTNTRKSTLIEVEEKKMVKPAAKPVIFATVFSTALMYKPLLLDLPMYRFISELL